MRNKRNKGFTLIELLAVIVILAVIALIATPLIMNVINDAKKGAARDAGYNIIKAGEQKAAIEQIDNVNPPYHYDETSNLDLKGTKPTKMTLDINKDMDTQLKAWLNGYCVVKEYENETVTIDESKKTEKDCVTGGSTPSKKYENGETIYFNPETNTKCSASEYKPDNSLNENKSGCMKWYAFNDSESSDTVNVILDHNTTASLGWNPGEKKIKETLKNDTNTWHDSLNARLIGANEIAQITGNTEFDVTVKGKDNYFYFENNSKIPPKLSQGEAKYKWLFDYTLDCTDYGCSIADANTNHYTKGYWINNRSVSYTDRIWTVDRSGYIVALDNGLTYYYGIRPVITIQKSLLQ